VSPRHGLVIAAGALLAVLGYASWGGSRPAWQIPSPPEDCRPAEFEQARFTHCIAVPGKHRIATVLTGRDGAFHRGFASLAEEIDPATVAFAMNGGMYGVTGDPIGYYVENGQRLAPLNRREASGNFYLKPNGVFFGESQGPWRVMTTEAFVDKISRRPDFGTQSGPMLVIGGKLHPKIAPDGTSLRVRNSVGIDGKGRAHFVISEQAVSFGTMARMMRDHAGARDALFLDGSVSALWHPRGERMDRGDLLGPLIVVTPARKSGR
jgi:uncharacterized protein YigE (DUF2233 family)